MKRRILQFLILLIIIITLPYIYNIILAEISGYPMISRDDKDRVACIESLEEIDLNDYNLHVNEDDHFKLTLYTQSESPKEYRHISIFATLEYIGSNDSITIWSGEPYYGYSIYKGDENFVDIAINTILKTTKIKKGEVVFLPFIKSHGYSSESPNALYWEMYGKDKYLRLPIGTYTLTVSTQFDLEEDSRGYENSISIEFDVTE